ncbi:AAA family ATPase [Candidatus Parabeggiatoa sp. HSG14]|uniref:AAA family ATPase n=1 Tax=Candidatus Parabeggiatoa sp. HSG14 TaxID=3055593 RepID=UPI0025A881AA|nr:AAA family ATPase [Thiotrichales bacterium HSG14]
MERQKAGFRLEVNNLGTIKTGAIDLSKALIIFAGQNNMGKSYMAYLIYGLYKIGMNENKVNEALLKIFASKMVTPIVKITAEPFLPHSVYFFPAERTAINMLAKEVLKQKAATLDELSHKVLAEEDVETIVKSVQNIIPRYPLAIRDYLFFINDLGYITRNESSFTDFADEIETLLQGKVSVSDYGDIKFTPQHSQKKLDIHISSSLVKSLSGLVLYFRHIAQKGDIIMIDEPELNLHPDNQLIVTRLFAKAVNKGFKVILSTHSDYIIKEFNNLIMLNKASDADRIEFGYCKEAVLDQGKVGAYFFSNNTIEPIEVSETGLTIKTIDTTIDVLDNTTENIYYRVFESV